MSLNTIHHLKLSWTTSKARDSYGYNIARLDDIKTGQRFKTCGGGYDMVGTVFADWLTSTFQAELLTLKEDAYYIVDKNGVNSQNKKFYGMYFYPEQNRVSLDGACGLDTILKIAHAIGLECEREYMKTGKRRGETIGYFCQINARC